MLGPESIAELKRMRAELKRLADKIDKATGFARNDKNTLAVGGATSAAVIAAAARHGIRLIWVKITGNETGGGKYQGKSYTHDGTTDVAATGNVAESELGTVASTVDCRVLNYAEEGETTHDLTAGTPENDTFLCHWYRTNSDGIKVCAVVAFDRETCEEPA
jgi:hypothetical protein